jgi:glycosyltransferase involved in cell wall biosynthesis
VPVLNGIRINRLAAASAEKNAPPKQRLSEVTFGFFGRFMPQKGFDVLLKALEIIHNKKIINDKSGGHKPPESAAGICVLATIDRHGYTNETLKQVENNPLLKNTIQFIESVPDITPLWEQIDALVMPSRWEACPLLPMEALAAGVPVIGSDALGLREVLAGTNCPTPPAGDAQALADAMLDFVKSPASCQWSETELTGFRQRFDVKNATEKLLKVYQDLTPVDKQRG